MRTKTISLTRKSRRASVHVPDSQGFQELKPVEVVAACKPTGSIPKNIICWAIGYRYMPPLRWQTIYMLSCGSSGETVWYAAVAVANYNILQLSL